MTLPRPRPTLLAPAALLVTSCMFGPTNDQRFASPSANVKVSGYVPSAGGTVFIEASPSPAGPWTTIGQAQAASSGFKYAGYTHHAFSTFVQIPAAMWQLQGCDRVAHLRAKLSGSPLSTFEAAEVSGQSAFGCITSEVSSGETLPNAVIACRSPDSPVVRVRAPDAALATHTGDIVLTSPADAAAFTCLETLDGNLTVEEETLAGFPTSLPAIALPNLEQVNGTVDIDYQLPFVPTGAQARQVDLPKLHTVTRDLILASFRLPAGADQASVQVGMPELTTVGGHVSIESDITGTTWYGLAGLEELPGDLTMDIFGDWSIFGLLENLRRVRGDVYLTLDNNGSTGLDALRQVDGSFTQDGGVHFASQGPAFANLGSVGGDFTLIGVPDSGPRLYPRLGSVGGTLRLDDSVSSPSGLTIGDPFLLLVGSVVIENNPLPTAPGLFNVEPNPPDPVGFLNNPNMCRSQIEQWIASRPFYFGPTTIVGNDDGC